MTTDIFEDTLEDEDEVVRITYYGDPGTCKTTNMAGMAKLGKILHIDTEGGLKPTALKRQGIPIENIVPFRRVTYSRLEDLVYEWLSLTDEGDPLPVIGVNIDTITAGIDRFVSGLVDAAVTKADAKGEERARWKTHLDDYGDMTSQWKTILRALRDLPVHMAISAHTQRTQDEESNIRMTPATTPGMQQVVTGYADVIINTRVMDTAAGTLPYGFTSAVGKYDGKDQFGVLPKTMARPSFDRIVDYVNERLTKDNDDEQKAAAAAMGAKPTNQEEKED